MAQAEKFQSDTIKDILPSLITYTNFLEYVDKLLFSTTLMSNKQTLRVSNQFSEEIVSINRSNHSNIDDLYFSKQMREVKDKSFKSFPVNVMALKVDWILTDPAGTQFLHSLLNSHKLDIYENRSILLIIEYMYKHYRRVILKYRLPVYML
mmetsp:Transcript_8199/g.12578  ORF Transcript_8199/g.12578 Transcript_8199/m.12578 type:complete len:151 (+) Transcript_8199:1179-1631(+)